MRLKECRHIFKIAYKLRIIIVVLLLLLIPLSVKAENNNWFINKTQKIWNTDNGLLTNSVCDIIQDSKGYIWIGTYDGLIRFDGVNFVVFNKNSKEGFNSNSARVLFEDSNGKLWIGTNENGVAIYDGKEFNTLSAENGLPSNLIRVIQEDKEGNIWVGTTRGLAKITKNQVKKVYMENVLITSILIDNEDNIWVISNKGDVYKGFKDKFEKVNVIDTKEKIKFQSIYQDGVGRIWLGTASNVIYSLHKNNSIKVYDMHGVYSINRFIEGLDKRLWFCADSSVGYYDEKKDDFFIINCEQGLIDGPIETICQDYEGSLWVASSRAGIQKFSPGKFNYYTKMTGLIDNVVNSICQSQDGYCWIGTDKGLSILYRGKFINNEIIECLKGIRIRHIIQDSQGRIWICTYSDKGLIQYDGKNIKSINKEKGLSSNKVRVVYEDHAGNIWAGTSSGLNKINNNIVEQVFRKGSNLTNEYIMSVCEDNQGNLLVGTDGGGVNVIKNDIVTGSYMKKDGLAGDVIFKIIVDYEDEIWITTNEGISLIDDDNIVNYTVRDGLPSDCVFQIILDENDNFWFATSKNIFQISRKDMFEYLAGYINNMNIKVFSKGDGLLEGITPNSWSCIEDNGTIWFSTMEGVTTIKANNYFVNEMPPRVNIEGIITDDGKYLVDNVIEVQPGNKRITIRYTGLSYVNPQSVLFKYYLEGFDKGWSEPSSKREVSYTNLPYGNYTFYVQACNNDGIWSVEKNNIEFYQRPYFFETKMFMIAVFICILILVLIFFDYRMRELKKRKDELKMIVVDSMTCLASAIDAKDPFTKGHSKRVSDLSMRIGMAMGLDDERLETLEYMALMHDIGKIGISDTILQKRSKLTKEEKKEIEKHTVIGANILSEMKSLKKIAIGARYHHESYDGTGYCEGLKGEDIPLEARIIAVADAYDAMVNDRPYRKKITHDAAVEEINRCMGTQFDPKIVIVFNTIAKEGLL